MTDSPRLLDLFCGAGGAAMGYHRAGFDVIGVDKASQPRYPFKATRADWMIALQRLTEGFFETHFGWFRLSDFDAIHASPPCQAFTAYKRTGNVGEYPDLIAPVRDALNATGLPWVMENVADAPLESPMMLCGSMFDLDVQRHRFFESNIALDPHGWPCRHKIWAPDRFPGGRSVERTGKNTGLVRSCVEIGSWDTPLPVQQAAMGMDWSNVEELSEAIPPAYTEHIGTQLRAYLAREVVVA